MESIVQPARYRIDDAAIPDAHAQIWVAAADQPIESTRMAVCRADGGPIAILPREWLVEVQ